MIPFILNEDGNLQFFLLCFDEDDDQRLIQHYAEARPEAIYFFADLCEPAEPKKAYFGWKEHPLIGGLLHQAYADWHLGGSEEDQDYVEAKIAEAAEACPNIIYFYVEES